jgi:NADH-quinone oxidoreductase subunit L
MLIGVAAAVGIPPFSGFWSQTAIAGRLIRNGNAVLISLLAVALFLFGLAAFRLYFLAFAGETVRRRRFEIDRIREPRAPLSSWPVVLAALAAVVGVVGIPRIARNVVSLVTLPAAPAPAAFDLAAVTLSTLPVLLGVAVAWIVYGRRLVSSPMLARRFAALHAPLRHAFFLDFLYRQAIRRGLLPLARAGNRTERELDHVLDRGGALAGSLGGVRFPSAVNLQRLLIGVLAGLLAMAGLVLALGAGWLRLRS